MNKNKIIEELCLKMGIKREQAKSFVEAFFNNIIKIIEDKGRLTLRGFGVFKVIERKEKRFLNPKTKKVYIIPPRKSIIFKPYKKLKKSLA